MTEMLGPASGSPTALRDPFLSRHDEWNQPPPGRALALGRNERILLLGDSITEARMYSCIVENHISMAHPELSADIRNLGKGGETASEFLKRLDSDCLPLNPTVAVISYGMNDSGYSGWNSAAAAAYGEAMRTLVRRLRNAGSRIVLCAPGCIGKLPPWPFLEERHETLEGLTETLLAIRNETADIADDEGLPFVDQFWRLQRARLESVAQYGEGYAVCGDDGVHPSWAGHAVMAHGILKALGLEGRKAAFRIDLAKDSASLDHGHRLLAVSEGIYTFASERYPYWSEGPLDRDGSVRSGMTLIPFDRAFNRWTLSVAGTRAERYRVTWMDREDRIAGSVDFTKEQLRSGIDLIQRFPDHPFREPFRGIEKRIRQKQAIEVEETWCSHESVSRTTAACLQDLEARRTAIAAEIRHLQPVIHRISIEELA